MAAFPCAFSIVHLLKSHLPGLLYKIPANVVIERSLGELCCCGVFLCLRDGTPCQKSLPNLRYGVATVSRIDKIIGLFCKSAL